MVTSPVLNRGTTELIDMTTPSYSNTSDMNVYYSTIEQTNFTNSAYGNSSAVSKNGVFSPNLFGLLYKTMCCGKAGHSSSPCQIFLRSFPYLSLPDNYEIGKQLQSVLVTLYVLIIAVSIVGNSLVLLTFIFNKHMRSTTNIFIVSLAGSDLLLIVSTVPFNIGFVISHHWTLGRFACKLVPFMTTFSVGCSSLTLCCIALDRFYAIVFPFKLHFFQTKFKMASILSTVWIVSALSGIPQAKSYELVEFTSGCGEKITECLFPKYETPQQQFLRLWLSFGILFMFPLMVMANLYGIIIHKLWGKFNFSTTSTVNRTDGSRLRQKRRAIKMLVTVISLFVVCWLPLQLFNIITEKSNTKISVTVNTIRVFLQCLAMSSSCYNPIVYAFMNEKFRKSFVLFLLCKKRRPRVYPVDERKDQNISRKVTQLKSETDGKRISGTAETRM